MHRHVSILLVLLAGCSAARTRPGPPVRAVRLSRSFRIRGAGGEAVSHVPLVQALDGGRQMAAWTDTGELVRWDAGTQRELGRSRPGGKPVRACALDARGRCLVLGRADGTLAAIEASSGRVLASVGGVGATHLAIDPAGERVAVAIGDRLELRALPSLTLLRWRAPGSGKIHGLAWDGAGRQLALVTEQGRLELLGLPALAPVHVVSKAEALHAVAFRPGAAQVAYGGKARKIYQRDLASGVEQVISGAQPYWITALGYSPDGRRLVAGDESCDVWLYQLDPRKLLHHSKHHVECWLTGVAWHPDSKRFLLGCRPNRHAGRPTVHAANQVAEARLAPPVRSAEQRIARLRARLRRRLAAVDPKLLGELERLGALEAAQADPSEPPVTTIGALIAMLKQKVETLAWASGQATVVNRNGMLVVRAPPSVQQAVGLLLDRARAEPGALDSLAAVPVTVAPGKPFGKVYNVRDMTVTIQDFRGIDLSGESERQAAERRRKLQALRERAQGDPELAALDRELGRAQLQRQELLQREIEQMRGVFVVNQWEVD